MSLEDKIQYLFIGGAVGFVLGYIVRTLVDIKEKVTEVDDILKKDRDEEGAMRVGKYRFNWKSTALFIVVVLTVVSSFMTASYNNRLKDSQDAQAATQARLDRVTSCNAMILDKFVTAADQRTTSAASATDLNAELQKAQSLFLPILLLEPPASEQRIDASLSTYLDKLNAFVQASADSKTARVQNPYPKPDELQNCIDGKD